jgi:hypothetical protein
VVGEAATGVSLSAVVGTVVGAGANGVGAIGVGALVLLSHAISRVSSSRQSALVKAWMGVKGRVTQRPF